MKVGDTPLAGLKLVQSTPHLDERGAFFRVFCAQELEPLLGSRQIAQINHSTTTRVGAVRGMHFQRRPNSEMKMIRCLRGRVWDVAVDVRADSPTFLQWHAEQLTQGDGKMFLIPEGFAHGFQALEADSELLYLHTAHYHPPSEGGLHHADPRLGISWPLPTTDLSERDRFHPLLDADFKGIIL